MTATTAHAELLTTHNRERAVELRELHLVLLWVRSLPPEGFTGTPTELGDSLYEVAKPARLTAYVPLRGATRLLSRWSGALRSAGWAVIESHTRTERKVRVCRA